jgi:predicted mannosyl-3-phosphoglycerate phosphatase (HAD superfamily)
MLDLQLELKPRTAEKFRKILNQYQSHEVFISYIIGYEISELERAIGKIQLDLRQFEEKYHLATSNFYKAFENGQIDDCEDYMIWAGIYELLLKNQQRLQELV